MSRVLMLPPALPDNAPVPSLQAVPCPACYPRLHDPSKLHDPQTIIRQAAKVRLMNIMEQMLMLSNPDNFPTTTRACQKLDHLTKEIWQITLDLVPEIPA